MATKRRNSGDVYRPVVKVVKAKNGTPTRVRFSGHEYVLMHPDTVNGAKNKSGRFRKATKS